MTRVKRCPRVKRRRAHDPSHAAVPGPRAAVVSDAADAAARAGKHFRRIAESYGVCRVTRVTLRRARADGAGCGETSCSVVCSGDPAIGLASHAP